MEKITNILLVLEKISRIKKKTRDIFKTQITGYEAYDKFIEWTENTY